MILSSHASTDGGLHQSAQRWEHIDWWINSSVVELSVDEDLAFSDIASQIRNRVSDIIIRHGQNRQLGDRTIDTFNSTSSLINGRKISIHVTRITSSTGHFFSGSRDFFQRVSIRRHIGQNCQDMHFSLVGEVFSSGEGQTRSNDSFNSRVIGQVHEENDIFHTSVLLEI